MRKYPVLFLLLAALAGAVPARAAEKALTLEECFQAALQRSETLANQKELIVQAEEHYRQAWGGLLPNLSGTASYGVQDNSGLKGVASSFFPAEQRLLKVTATQPLFRGFREYAALRQSGDLIVLQKEAYQWARIQLYQDVAQGFYGVLAWETDLKLLDDQIRLYDQRIRDLQARVRIGRSRTSEVLTVQAAQASLRAQRQQVQGQRDVSREVLAFLTGLDAELVLADAESLPAAPAPEETYLTKLEERPDVRAARKQVEAAKENIGLASGAHWPSVDASGNYYFERTGSEQPVKWDAGIALTLSIFAGGTVLSKTREAESQARQSENALGLLLRQDAQDLRTFYANLNSDLAQTAANAEAADLTEQNYRAVLKDYDLGLVTNLDVLVAMTSSLDAQRSLERSRFTSKLDALRLEAAAMLRPQALGGEATP